LLVCDVLDEVVRQHSEKDQTWDPVCGENPNVAIFVAWCWTGRLRRNPRCRISPWGPMFH